MSDLSTPANLGDLLSNPQRVRDAFALLRLLQTATSTKVVPASATTNNSLIISAQQILIPIPLGFEAAIADSTAVAASVSTQLNLLLAALRRNKQLPS